MATTAPPTKGDIINRLIRQHGLKRYLEYNKFDGATYYNDIVCEHKEIAYLPERSYLDAGNLRRLLDVAKDAALDSILPLDRLLEKYRDSRFDIIFFDPVHERPDVDHALQVLPCLLNPGGFLVVHDCNPGLFSQTTLQRKPDSWVGETYKAFTVFRAHNRERTITVAEDFGVGLIWNVDLDLDYDIDFDIDYFVFADHRRDYIGLISYDEFLARTANGDAVKLFEQAPPEVAVQLLPLTPGTPTKRSQTPQDPTAGRVPSTARRASSQLFWRRVGAQYVERTSCEWPISFDGKRQHLQFLLSDLELPLERLRFDFADSLGIARLDSMVLKNSQAEAQWRWNGRHELFENVVNMVFLETAAPSPEVFMMSRTSDPHFELILPADVLTRMRSGWAMEVEMTPLPDFVNSVFSELAACRSALQSQAQREAAMQARLAALEARLDEGFASQRPFRDEAASTQL